MVPKPVSQPHFPPPQLTEKLLDLENENMMRVAELEKQLLQREKELEVVKVHGEGRWGAGQGPVPRPPSLTLAVPRRPTSTRATRSTRCGG